MASPWPGLTWKNKLNSLVGPTARPGREVAVSAVTMLTPQWPPGSMRVARHRAPDGTDPPSRTRDLRPSSAAGERHAHRSARPLPARQVVTSGTCICTDVAGDRLQNARRSAGATAGGLLPAPARPELFVAPGPSPPHAPP